MWRRVRVALVPYCIGGAQTYTNDDRGTFWPRRSGSECQCVANSHAVTKHSTENLFLAPKKRSKHLKSKHKRSKLFANACMWKIPVTKNLEESGIYISWPKPWIIALVKFACENYLFCVISYLKSVLTLKCRYKSP